jgi:hypothetical protein
VQGWLGIQVSHINQVTLIQPSSSYSLSQSQACLGIHLPPPGLAVSFGQEVGGIPCELGTSLPCLLELLGPGGREPAVLCWWLSPA